MDQPFCLNGPANLGPTLDAEPRIGATSGAKGRQDQSAADVYTHVLIRRNRQSFSTRSGGHFNEPRDHLNSAVSNSVSVSFVLSGALRIRRAT